MLSVFLWGALLGFIEGACMWMLEELRYRPAVS